ncbi:MAG TPA: S41 family peptidase [Ideonella sp.]|uniref:S41 family peptidase n=1 Tax=Ideonella sp. TaxID=1929293 RepID=UPI002E2EC701|nr:S41 family peptidase [Ideonella sp.]HEX5684488.1 S41 family peptidase [Ideonella sp.]
MTTRRPPAPRWAFMWSTLALCAAACAQPTPAPTPDAPLSATQRKAIVDTLAQNLRSRYVYPERIEPVAKQLQARAAKGAYDGAQTVEAMGEALNKDLREFGDDRHFRVEFDPGVEPVPAGAEPSKPTRAEVERERLQTSRMAYGITRLQRLPGNIGYLDLRGFGPTEFVAHGYDAAMLLLGGTDALVLDLRNNGGGEPQSVSYLLSHFFAEGDERHLNDIYDRPTNTTREYRTLPLARPRYTKPIVVLTSKNTFSGGEECAYDLQTQKRATLYGETTGGAANPGEMVALGHGLAAFVPTGRAINAVTKKDWEKVGVVPDVALPAADALKAAYLALLEQRVREEKTPEELGLLKSVLARAQAGAIDLPPYTPRR